MQKIIYICDDCGEEFDKTNMPPWAPDYCPKCRDKHSKLYETTNNYTSKSDPNLRVWW